MTTWQGIFTVCMVFLCLFLVLVILIQRGRGSGLAGAFGGAGGSSAFGAKTGDILTWITVVVAVVFISFNVVLNFVLDQTAKATPAPTVTSTSFEVEIPAETADTEVVKAEPLFPDDGTDIPLIQVPAVPTEQPVEATDKVTEESGSPAPSEPKPSETESPTEDKSEDPPNP